MGMTPVICFEDVYKKYQLGSRRAAIRYLLPGTVAHKPDNGKQNPNLPAQSNELWALKGVSFEVRSGEMIGLIGPNGAGKTTILSLLSGITNPTSGKITVKGRVGALIKLGAGFHPDLTGRENIYLNGSILGLKKAEVDRLYDKIVEFAELEKFMETPVKRYSSGMYVRLGFSIAVHINPEILLLDEVLSVGDVTFQSRCFNRIGELKDSGSTIILVSHNMHQISGFCDRVIYLNQGEIKDIGEPDQVIKKYLDNVLDQQLSSTLEDGSDLEQVNGSGRMVITDVAFLDCDGNRINSINSGEPLTIRVFYVTQDEVIDPLLDLVIRDTARGNMFQATNRDFGIELGKMGKRGHIDITLDGLTSNNQVLNFFFTFWDSDHTEQYDWKRYLKLKVVGKPSSSGRHIFNCDWKKSAD
jgi:ABC-type polysaccharide/polyol phosphate transport system ATPase subunit